MFKPREWAVTAGLLVAGVAGLLWITDRELRSSDRDAELLMRAQAQSISDLVGESGLHGLEMYRHWEDEVAARLLDNARWLSRRDSLRPLTSAELGALARMHRLGRINVFDAKGEKTASSVEEDLDEGLTSRHEPRDFMGPILRGETREVRIGFKPARFSGGSRFAVAVARRGGGAIVVNVFADSMRVILDRVRPEHLLATLGHADGVRYVVLQRGDSLLASAAKDGSKIPPPLDSLRGAPGVSETQVRERPTPNGRVYEMVRDIRPNDAGAVQLRIGLDAGPLDRARADALHRAWVRGIVFLLAAVLWTALLLQRERHRWLSAEVERIREELEQHERDAQRNARLVAMGELAAHVAHEIRNPLNTIQLTAQQMAREPGLAETFHTLADDIRAESQRIEMIVRQFLDFARPRKPQPQPLDLLEAVRAAAHAAEPLYAESGLRLEVAGTPSPTQQDPFLLAEVLDNLLRNACEASPRGGVVRASAARDGAEVYVAIEDEGAGVPPAMRERIFDPYFTTKTAGTGLGLSIVSQILTAMGGSVSVEDARGQGARFVVRFPAEGPDR